MEETPTASCNELSNGQQKYRQEAKPFKMMKNLLHVQFNPHLHTLTVTKKSRNFLATMGIPQSNGGHVLYPEEAVFLLETFNAIIFLGPRSLTLHEGYRILEEQCVPPHVYATYCTLRNAGFVAVRPRMGSPRSETAKETTRCSQQNGKSRFPQHLMDCFPTLVTSASPNAGALHMTHLHHKTSFVPEAMDLKNLSNPKISSCTKRKVDRRGLRPVWWPPLAEAVKAATWKEYCEKKELALNGLKRGHSNRRSEKRRFGGQQTHQHSMYEPGFSPISGNSVDFDLYLPTVYTHSVVTEPAYSVICFDARDRSLDFCALSRRDNSERLLVAIFDYGTVNFLECSGQPIDITQKLCHQC